MEKTPVPYGNETVRVFPTEEVRRVHHLLEEMNRFLHQPLNYGENYAVSKWLDSGVYAELSDVYYNLLWHWLPDSEKRRTEEE